MASLARKLELSERDFTKIDYALKNGHEWAEKKPSDDIKPKECFGENLPTIFYMREKVIVSEPDRKTWVAINEQAKTVLHMTSVSKH